MNGRKSHMFGAWAFRPPIQKGTYPAFAKKERDGARQVRAWGGGEMANRPMMWLVTYQAFRWCLLRYGVARDAGRVTLMVLRVSVGQRLGE